VTSLYAGVSWSEVPATEGALPIGLAHHVRLMRDIAATIVRWAAVAISYSEALAG
jgi:hypothetical protein